MKAAIIGVGRMGRRHIQVVRDVGLKLVGVSDQSDESIKLACQEYGLSADKCFSDACALLEKTKPECVIVATTSPSHCAYTCLAAETGAKYILCEKPMAVSLAECDRMIDVCRANGSRLAINHQRRFMEWYTEPKRIIESETFGGLSSVTVIAGNGGMAMQGTHYFEMFRQMVSEEPVEVSAWFSPDRVPNPRGPQFEDPAGTIRFTTRSGKRFYMDIGSDQGHGMKVIYAGLYGQIVVDEVAGQMYVSLRQEDNRNLPTTRIATPSVDSVIPVPPAESLDTTPTRDVLHALTSDSTAPSGEDGRMAIEVLVAAFVSHESGHRLVRLDEALPRERVFQWP